MNWFEDFARRYNPPVRFVQWMNESKFGSMEEMWSGLLNSEQDTTIEPKTRIDWAFAILSRSDLRGLAEVAWRFVTEAFPAMPAESKAGVEKMRKYLDGDQTVNSVQVERALAKVYNEAPTVSEAIAAKSALAFADTVEAVVANDKKGAREACFDVVVSAVYWKSPATETERAEVEKRRLEIVREVVLAR